MKDVAVFQAGRQCNESAARALKCLGVVVEVLGLPRVLDAKAHVDAVVALIEKRVVLANYAMAVGAVTCGVSVKCTEQQRARHQDAFDQHANLHGLKNCESSHRTWSMGRT
ncbi:hypothetical protein D3C87_1178120 [compost metagenome]